MVISKKNRILILSLVTVIFGIAAYFTTKKGNIDGLRVLFIIANFIVLFGAVLCSRSLINSIKMTGKLLYETKIENQALQDFTIVFLAVVTVLMIILKICSGKTEPDLPPIIMMGLLTIMFFERKLVKSGIYENGIVYFGAYLPWDKIKELSLEKSNEVGFLLLPQKEYIMTNYTVKLFYKPEAEAEIKAYLERKFQQPLESSLFRDR